MDPFGPASGIALDCPRSWRDITKEVEAPDPPWTLARADGVGALQFSIALYQGGERPGIGAAALTLMAEQSAEAQGLGVALWRSAQKRGRNHVVSRSYRPDPKAYVRVWYLSDGLNVAFVTYLCDWKSRKRREEEDARAIVGSLHFRKARR